MISKLISNQLKAFAFFKQWKSDKNNDIQNFLKELVMEFAMFGQ